MRRRLAVALIVIIPTFAEARVDPPAVSEFVEAQMRRSRIPGVAVAVVGPGEAVYAEGFTLGGRPIGPDTPFLLGSVTKTITALAIAQLADGGRLRFDDPVSMHLPDFRIRAADSGKAITIRHLLTHTSGLRQWSGHDRRAQHEGRFDHIAPARPPGSAFEYSSLNYIILGSVIERISGMSYGEYVKQFIFTPLEMTNSFADLESARRRGLAPGHRYLYGLTMPASERQQPAPLIPTGFLISSARDLANYLSMLLNDGRFRERQIVSPAILREMFTPWDGAPTGPGMGWGIGSTTIGHAGSTPASSARLSLLPAHRMGIVVLTNVNSGPFFSGTAALSGGVTRIARGESAAPIRPDEILLKLALLALVLFSVVRLILRLRQWSRRGFPRRFVATRRTLMPLVTEAAAAILAVIVLPRWIGVPLLTILEYFPDLGIAIVVSVVIGISGAIVRSLLLSDGRHAADTLHGSATSSI
ncbi:MAG TPA: serine hydrolase domain-containing protein [Thermoanaerobaculia bacterium]